MNYNSERYLFIYWGKKSQWISSDIETFKEKLWPIYCVAVNATFQLFSYHFESEQVILFIFKQLKNNLSIECSECSLLTFEFFIHYSVSSTS